MEADQKIHSMEQELEEAKQAAQKFTGAQQLLEQLVEQGVLQQMPDGSVKPVFQQVNQGELHEQLLN